MFIKRPLVEDESIGAVAEDQVSAKRINGGPTTSSSSSSTTNDEWEYVKEHIVLHFDDLDAVGASHENMEFKFHNLDGRAPPSCQVGDLWLMEGRHEINLGSVLHMRQEEQQQEQSGTGTQVVGIQAPKVSFVADSVKTIRFRVKKLISGSNPTPLKDTSVKGNAENANEDAPEPVLDSDYEQDRPVDGLYGQDWAVKGGKKKISESSSKSTMEKRVEEKEEDEDEEEVVPE